MIHLRSVLAALIVPVAVVPAVAQAPVADSAARVESGRAIFEGRGLCFSCHGKAGDGVLGPTTSLVGRPLTHTRPTAPEIAALIRTGVDSAHSTSGQIMPARGGSRINDADVDAVATYILVLRQKAIKP
jgi:mono/diheme cytochrome c family protein